MKFGAIPSSNFSVHKYANTMLEDEHNGNANSLPDSRWYL